MIAGICDQQNDEQPGDAVGACKILVADQYGDLPSLVPLAAAVVGIVDSVNAVTNMHSIQIFTPKVSKKMPKRSKKFGRSQRRGGNRKLGYRGEGLKFVGDATAPYVAQAGTTIAKLSSKDISKRNLLSKLQWTEISNHSLTNLSSNSFLSSNLQ
jgi:hypothetical protein